VSSVWSDAGARTSRADINKSSAARPSNAAEGGSVASVRRVSEMSQLRLGATVGPRRARADECSGVAIASKDFLAGASL